jgi:hypothetical protein
MKVHSIACSAGVVDTVGVVDGQMVRLVGVTWHQFDEARTCPEPRKPCLVFSLGVANMGLAKPTEVRGAGGRDTSRVFWTVSKASRITSQVAHSRLAV